MKNNIKSKKLKYGSLSIVFTIVFIVLIIALNLVVSSLADSVGLKIDLTDEQLFSLSNETDVALQVALGEEYKTFDVTIYFLAERDIYEYYDMNFYAASGQDKSYYTRVRDLTEEYQRKYSNNIKVEFVDINKEPELANKYKNESQTALTANNIIIQGKYHYRIITFDSLYQRSDKDNSLYSFNGEQRLTAAILQASLAEAPVISFTTGHGEKHDSALDEIFAATEFNVKTVDLMKENIDPKTKILVIFNPLSDFIGYDVNSTGTNEIDKITTYMADKTNFNSLMVFVNSSTESLPNLREYLWDYWGMDYIPNYKLVDEKNSLTNGTDFYSVVGDYVTTQVLTAGSVLHKTASESDIRSVFRDAVALKIDKTGNRNTIAEVSIKAFDSAYTLHNDGSGALVKETGEYPLLAVSTYKNYGENNAVKFKYVMLCGSTDFAAKNFLTKSFGNSSIMYSAIRNMSTDRVVPDIDAKVFENTALTLTTGEADVLMWIVSLTVPLIMICIGTVVFFKRRHL